MFSPIKSQILICTLILAGALTQSLQGQSYQLSFHGNSEDLKEIRRYSIAITFSDSTQMLEQIDNLYRDIQAQGRLQAKFTTVWSSASRLEVAVALGPVFQWLHLNPGNVDTSLLQKAGFKGRFYQNKPFHYREVADLLQELIKQSGESGYPFASVQLDSVNIKEPKVAATLNYQQGPGITFDSINVQSDFRISQSFLQNYLRITPGNPFSESSVQEAAPKLNRLPYLTLSELPQLSFQNNQATTYLSLEKRKANRIDGIIGFLPNAKDNRRILLTGQFNLLLQNMFGAGRSLDLQWESFKPQSQLLKVAFFQPLLFRSPINTSLGFKLLKEDSTFVNTQFDIDFSYLFKSYGALQVYSHLKSTRLSATSVLQQATELPDFSDFDLTEYGVGYEWTKLDDILNPTRGIHWKLNLAGGTKKIRRNSSVNDSLYNDLDFENVQVTWEAQLQRYWKVSKRWVIAGKLRGGGVYNKRLFFNDLFRLGGLKSLRGFSENSFFAAEFIYSSIEPRFFIDTDSYLFVFYDQAWQLQYELENESFTDTPSGFGAGLSLTTVAGNFNLAWAIGKSRLQELGLQQSKIHFGYVTKF